MSLNKVQIIGNLGADPEVRYMPDGKPVATMSVAVTEKWKTKDGEKKERTEWVRVSAFAGSAEFAETYLKKGAQVYVEGKLVTQSWDDKNTQVKRYSTVVYAANIQMLGSRRDDVPTPPAAERPSEKQDFDDGIPF